MAEVSASKASQGAPEAYSQSIGKDAGLRDCGGIASEIAQNPRQVPRSAQDPDMSQINTTTPDKVTDVIDGARLAVAAAQSAGPVLVCDRIVRRFGGVVALKDVSVEIRRGEIFGLVGPNGSGKTTLVNAITGFYPPQEGQLLLDGVPINRLRPAHIAARGVARTFQNVALFHGMSVLDNILMGRHIFMKPNPLASLFYPWWARREEIAHRHKVEEVIDLLQLEAARDEQVDVIPLGLQKRVELARALCAEPKLLVLDEPMAGMNQEEKEYMVRFILDARAALGLTVLIIEHHMDVITAICDRVLVLNNGREIAQGPAREAIAVPAVIEAYIGKASHAA
jgi:branched-chain amino acid transport system ATP-binding protein